MAPPALPRCQVADPGHANASRARSCASKTLPQMLERMARRFLDETVLIYFGAFPPYLAVEKVFFE